MLVVPIDTVIDSQENIRSKGNNYENFHLESFAIYSILPSIILLC